MTDEHQSDSDWRVPIAAIGASAGGIEALQEFFANLPEPVGAAFVVIVHLGQQSNLPRIIATRTRMPVVEVHEEQSLEADKVFVIPPNRQLVASGGRISAVPFDEPRGHRAPIDRFFRSIADEHGDGFAIILSGAGADGAVGVKAIKEAGGLILVQDPDEASYPSMPRSAIASGIADFVLPVRELAERLPALVQHKQDFAAGTILPDQEEIVSQILTHLRTRTGNDFTHYKRATVLRRLARRMQVSRIGSLDDYFARLRVDPSEAEALTADLLISVTSFFRDPEAFEALARDVIPKLFEPREESPTVRVWVAGCATGEEAYSILMLLLEEAERHDEMPDIQVFASDLDGRALAIAREGAYPAAIEADVSETRLRKFFTRDGERYKIRREVRDLVVFAVHSLLRDPPFSHIDMISCRNLLIYLDRDLQNQICRTFHYALRPHGYLFLGSSETIDARTLFHVLDRQAHIFQALEQARELPPIHRVLTRPRVTEPVPVPFTPFTPRAATRGNYAGDHRQALEQVAPPSILVDQDHRVLNLSESAGRFLVPPAGPLSNVVTDLVRPELRLELQAALHRAFDENEPTLTLPLAVQFNGNARQVSLYVWPISRDGMAPSALVLFMEGKLVPESEHELPTTEGATSNLVAQLRSELSTTQAHLRTSREQYETINEELRASNEELQSTNEEYRSTAEELETSREELQSINEELQTLNNELKIKLENLSRAHNDLQNLMSATEVATLFLDTKLRIHRFTPRLSRYFSVVAGDEGRPITDFTHRLDYPDLLRDAARVLSNLAPNERTIRTQEGEWLLMRMRPYRTIDDRIDGIVLTLVDVTEQHDSEQRWGARQRELAGEFRRRMDSAMELMGGVIAHVLHGAADGAQAQAAVARRMAAIRRTNDLIPGGGVGATEFGAVAMNELTASLGSSVNRVRLEGPPVALAGDVAMRVGLLLHELAANAMSAGALTRSEGRIGLRWEAIEGKRGKRVEMAWTESGDRPAGQAHDSAGVVPEFDVPGVSVWREVGPDRLVYTIELPLWSRADDGTRGGEGPLTN